MACAIQDGSIPRVVANACHSGGGKVRRRAASALPARAGPIQARALTAVPAGLQPSASIQCGACFIKTSVGPSLNFLVRPEVR